MTWIGVIVAAVTTLGLAFGAIANERLPFTAPHDLPVYGGDAGWNCLKY